MQLKIFTSVILLLLLFSACEKDRVADPIDTQLAQILQSRAPDGSLDYFILPDENDLAAIPAGVGNPLSREKIELGKLLFFETALARHPQHPEGMNTYSCATCHVPEAGFMPGRKQGIADGAIGFGQQGESRELSEVYEEEEIDAQGARPLSMLGVAYVTNSMWAGRFGANHVNEGTEHIWGVNDPATEINELGLDGLESQNIEGIELHRMVVDDYVLDELGYREYFDRAFADWPSNARYGIEATSFALSAYIRQLMPNQAPYQYWLKGEHSAMTISQKRGALLFFGKAGCYRCHTGPALNSMQFQAIGVNDLCDVGGLRTSELDERNKGRGGFTRKEEDNYKFKVPQLYNLKDSPFYFHGSSKNDLRDVVVYFNEAIPENPRVPQANISPFFHPLNLTEDEIDDLTDFIANGLRDPNLTRYAPTSVLSGNCIPNNDDVSRADIGCE